MTTTPPNLNVTRGEIWSVRFDPTIGDEIAKERPAAVMNIASVGRLKLHIVVPITEWSDRYLRYPWMIKLTPTPSNGLTKDSAADAFQVKSLSQKRFVLRKGSLTPAQMDEIAAAIALCVGL